MKRIEIEPLVKEMLENEIIEIWSDWELNQIENETEQEMQRVGNGTLTRFTVLELLKQILNRQKLNTVHKYREQ